jgi:hypothetical protein
MQTCRSILQMGRQLEALLLPKLYPELSHVPQVRWSSMLRHARQTELAVSERLGVLAAVAIAAYALQPIGEGQSLIIRYLVQFAIALPTVALLAAPWLVRRTRRGLQIATSRFNGGELCKDSQTAAAASPSAGKARERRSITAPTRHS